MRVKLFQDGGAMGQDPNMAPKATPAPAPEEQMPQEGGALQGGQDPQQIAMQLTEQIIQQFGPEFALMLADMLQQAVQGGGGAPAQAPQAQPAFQRRGGRLIRIR